MFQVFLVLAAGLCGFILGGHLAEETTDEEVNIGWWRSRALTLEQQVRLLEIKNDEQRKRIREIIGEVESEIKIGGSE